MPIKEIVCESCEASFTIEYEMLGTQYLVRYCPFCNEELTDAHSAHADTKATHDVLIAQLDRYQELEPNIAFLNEFSSRRKTVDFAGFVVYNKDEEACFGFGKHKGKKVTDILANEPGYFGWVMNADFPRYTKKILTEIRLSQMNTNL